MHYDYLVDQTWRGTEGQPFSQPRNSFKVYSTIQGAIEASRSWQYVLRLRGRKLPLPRWVLKLVARILKRPRAFVAPGTYKEQITWPRDSTIHLKGGGSNA